MLPLAGQAVTKDGFIWYPVLKNGKVYYVRNDCVQLVAGTNLTLANVSNGGGVKYDSGSITALIAS